MCASICHGILRFPESSLILSLICVDASAVELRFGWKCMYMVWICMNMIQCRLNRIYFFSSADTLNDECMCIYYIYVSAFIVFVGCCRWAVYITS